MIWKIQPDNKLKNKGHSKDNSPFIFSFHHTQLDITITYSLDAGTSTDIDKSISDSIDKSISYSIDKLVYIDSIQVV